MSGISSGVGLFSGIDSKSLIDQLIAIDAQPKQLIQKRISELQQQQAAYLDLNSALLGLKTAAGAFSTSKIFDAAKATSSAADILTATAANNAASGTFSFSVARLVSTQQLLSRGFTDKSTSAVGATKFTFETGGGNLETETTLAELNGGAGVARGKIVLTNTTSGSGTPVTIDLSSAVTVNDVVDAINNNGQISVTASVDGDKIKLSGTGAVTSFSVGSASGGRTAADLGIEGASSSGVVTGAALRTISGNTALRLLNDGNGVHIKDGAPDLAITLHSGAVLNVQLGEISHTVTDTDGKTTKVIDQARAATVQDVINIINKKAKDVTGADGNLTASISSDGRGLQIVDNTTGSSNLIIASASGRTTAEDLGISTGSSGTAGTTVAGQRLLAGINSRLTRNILGGGGLTGSTLTVTDRLGNSKSITLSASAVSGSVQEVIKNINDQLADTGVGGVQVKVKAQVNRAGNGISLTDSSGGSGNLIVAGNAGDALGLSTTVTGTAGNYLDGKNLQSKWISKATLLKDLNLGKGVGTGTVRVTDSTGVSRSIEIKDTLSSVDDLLSQFKSQFVTGLDARINANGDGIEIVDTLNGTGKLKIEDASGSVAKNLNLVGESAVVAGVASRDGSFEKTVSFEAADTLETIVNKVNAAGVGFNAAIIRDGSSGSPFRISFTAKDSGARGRTLVDTGALDLGLSSLTKGDDAVAFFGNADPAKAILLTSSTNTLDQVVQGVTIDLKGVSSTPVQVTVTRDQAAIEKSIGDFVTSFNRVLDTIDKYDSYNSDTNKKGVLLGDTTVSLIRSQMLAMVQGTPKGVQGSYQRLFQVGVKIGTGAKLEFDSAKFRTAYSADPQNVEDLFAASTLAPKKDKEIAPGVTVKDTTDVYTNQGVAEQLSKLAGSLTSSVDGTLTQRGKTIDSQITLQRDRSAQIDIKLTAKRARLEAQFLAMEKAIGDLKNQSNALSSLG